MRMNLNSGTILSARAIVGETLHEFGRKHENVWALTPDVGGALKAFKKDFADRFVDTGIAEQNVVGIAAGLALEGNIPFVMGMSPFLTMRSCEQVRTAVCYQNLPVRIIGSGGGIASEGGSTHYAMEDIAIMKSLVNMTVVSVSDPNMVREILDASLTYPGPLYIRLTLGKADPVFYEPGTIDYEIGKGVTAREGKDATIIAHGEMVYQALSAAELLAEQGIDTRVIDMYSIKPFDQELVIKAVNETGKIVVLEDHLMEGGLASSIADFFVHNSLYPKAFRRLGVPQVYPGFGSGAQLRAKYGYDTAATAATVKEILNL